MPALGQRTQVQVTEQGKSDSTLSGFYEDFDLSGVTKLRVHRWIPSATPLAGFITITDATGDTVFADIPIKTNLGKTLELGFTLVNPTGGFVVSTSDAGMDGQLVVTAEAYKTSTGAPVSDPDPPDPPDYRLFATPASNSISAGSSAVFTISVVSLFGFNQNVTLTADTVISGVSYSFSSNTVQGAGSVGLTITTTALATVATHTITVTGVSGGLTHSVDFDLTINAAQAADFTLGATPSSQTVVQGVGTTYSISNTALNGFAAGVTLTCTPGVTGVGVSFSPNPMSAGSSSTMTVTTTGATPAATHTLTVTGTSGSLVHTVAVGLVVTAAPTADFSLTSVPLSRTIQAGASTTFDITHADINGFAGAVTLTCTPGVSGVSLTSITNNPQASGQTSVVTFGTTTAATQGTHQITITGTSGALVHTVVVSLTITAPPDFTLSVSPPSTVVVQGQATTVTVSNTAIAGFSSTISLAATPAISGITYGFSPDPMLAGASSVLTITAAAGATAGTQTVTITATSGLIVHTAPVTLTVQSSSGSGETGTAIISMRNPSSVSSVNATLKCQTRMPDPYTPVITFDYRAVGSTTWIATTPIGRTNNYRWADCSMHIAGLTPSTAYEYRVRVADLATGTLTNNSENLASGTTVVQFTTKAVGDISTFGSRAITSGITMPTYALPGSPASGLVTEANPRLFTSLCQRAGGTQAYDIIVYGTDNPSAKTAGTIELYFVGTANAGTDAFTPTSQSVHFVAANTPVVFTSTGTVPPPLVSGTTYYVKTATSTSFTVTDAPNGSLIDLSGAGTGTITCKATTSYSSHWLAKSIKNHAVIGTVVGLEGADAPRASHDTATAAALATAGWTPLYEEGGSGVVSGTSAWGCTLGTSATGNGDVAWPGNVCITGVSVVGIGTVSTTVNPPQVAGEPICSVGWASSGGGCNNFYLKNVKYMSTTGHSVKIAGTASDYQTLATGSPQAAGLLGFYNVEFRAWRENLQAVSAGGYSNENGWGTKTHLRLAGNSRLDVRSCRASWTKEHWFYVDGISADTSGTDGSWFIDLSDHSGMRGTIDLNQDGFGSTAFQIVVRASPDSFKFKNAFFGGAIAHIHQLTDPAMYDQVNYDACSPGRGPILLKNVALNGYDAGSGGSFPYSINGHLGTITIDSCSSGHGGGFGLMCDTGKGHFMLQGSDGFWYANGPIYFTGTGLTYTTSDAYLKCGLCINSSTDAVIGAMDASLYGGNNVIGHFVSGQSGKNGNANAAMGPVDDGPTLGPCLKIKHGFGAVYAGWTGGSYATGEIKYRFGFSDQTSYAASSANALNGVYVTRGDAAGTNYFAP